MTKSLILNSPYVAPAHHWRFVEESQPLERVEGRRIAGYMADDAKHDYMRGWISAVNQHGGFGQWAFSMSSQPSDIKDILAKRL